MPANLNRHHQYYVYIMTNSRHAPPYVGVTNDLVRRVYEHKHKAAKGFASSYTSPCLCIMRPAPTFTRPWHERNN